MKFATWRWSPTHSRFFVVYKGCKPHTYSTIPLPISKKVFFRSTLLNTQWLWMFPLTIANSLTMNRPSLSTKHCISTTADIRSCELDISRYFALWNFGQKKKHRTHSLGHDRFIRSFSHIGVRFRPRLINFANFEIFNFAARRNQPSL